MCPQIILSNHPGAGKQNRMQHVNVRETMLQYHMITCDKHDRVNPHERVKFRTNSKAPDMTHLAHAGAIFCANVT